MKRKFLLAFALLVMLAAQSMAQFSNFEGDSDNRNTRNHPSSILSRMRFGGDFGMSFGSRALAVQINPCVSYEANQYISVGVIGTFEYYQYDYDWLDQSSATYGGGIFAEAHPWPMVNIHAETQLISYTDYYSNMAEPSKCTAMPVLVGAGYRKMVNERSSLNIMLLWNINDSFGLRNNTSFQNPIFRVSFMF